MEAAAASEQFHLVTCYSARGWARAKLEAATEEQLVFRRSRSWKRKLMLRTVLWSCLALFHVCIAAAETKSPRVVKVDPEKARLGESITVDIENLDSQAAKSLLPFFDEHLLKGSKVEWSDGARRVRFALLRDGTSDDSKRAWVRVLGGFKGTIRRYHLSAGAEGTGPYAGGVPFRLEVIPARRGWVALGLMAGLLALFVLLVVMTNILRRRGDKCKDDCPFSLSRFQMAVWTFVIAGCLLAIWLITGDLMVPDSALVLMGISAATGLGAIMIGDPPAQPGSGKFSLHQFLIDILSDKGGVSFHRFQLLVFTAVSVLVFISQAIDELAMPELPASLLLLMGISSGLYLGFKFPEKKKK